MADYLHLSLATGLLGGCLLHIYWLISIAVENKGNAISAASENSRFRIKAFILNTFAGGVAGFITWVWFYDQVIPHNKLAVIAFIAGLSG